MEAVPEMMRQSLTMTIKIRNLQRRRHAMMNIEDFSIVVVPKEHHGM